MILTPRLLKSSSLLQLWAVGVLHESQCSSFWSPQAPPRCHSQECSHKNLPVWTGRILWEQTRMLKMFLLKSRAVLKCIKTIQSSSFLYWPNSSPWDIHPLALVLCESPINIYRKTLCLSFNLLFFPCQMPAHSIESDFKDMVSRLLAILVDPLWGSHLGVSESHWS